MSIEHDSRIVTERPGPEIQADVTVSTATAIISLSDDPYMVLVADSAKHRFPVLPGGKQEATDVDSGKNPGLECVLREVEEEIGTSLKNARFIGVATDPDRDIRIVPASKLKGAVVSKDISSLSDEAQVRAHYGCPDELYIGNVDKSAIQSTEELSDLRFINIRTLQPGDLSAGHDVVVLWYRNMLENGLDQLPEGSLTNFALEAEQFTKR